MLGIKEIIIDELARVSLVVSEADLDFPKSLKNGDIAVFIKEGEIDQDKVSKINHEYIESVAVVGKFVNFFLSKKFFNDCLEKVLKEGGNFARNQNLSGKKIIVEYTDPNPFKEFHIGHLMSNAVGESISRLAEWSDAELTRANYQGDVGPQVAKAIWGIIKLSAEKPEDSSSHKDKVAFLGRAYVIGANAYEESEKDKEEIKLINKKVYDKSDSKINDLYEWGRKISLDQFEVIYKKLGTKFDRYFFESQTAPIGMFVIEELLNKGILEKSEGAVIFRGENYGLHTRVFVNSQGLPTYETKELGLTKMKFDLKDWDQSIVITAHEQKDFFDVVLKVLEFADHRAANRTRHISHGMMRFAEGKMSSRKGNVITGESLISDVEKLVLEKISDRDLSQDEKAEIATQVAVGAIKYSVLRQSPGKDIVFDFDKSLSFEGDSGPYLQYTRARINSLIRKAGEAGIEPGLDEEAQTTEIEKLIARFPAVVSRAQVELAPQLISTYLINLSSAFNSFYAENQIIGDDEKMSAHRVALSKAVGNILGVGLHLLGIPTPERM